MQLPSSSVSSHSWTKVRGFKIEGSVGCVLYLLPVVDRLHTSASAPIMLEPQHPPPLVVEPCELYLAQEYEKVECCDARRSRERYAAQDGLRFQALDFFKFMGLFVVIGSLIDDFA